MNWYENKNLRSYNTKTYQKSFRERKTSIHASYIHYDNSIRKIGDGKGKFRKVDKNWLNEGTKYYFEFANNPVEAPKFANGPIKHNNFLKEQGVEIVLEPDCNPVLGIISGSDIVYADAFGAGIDLILRPNLNGLKKLIKINESVKESKEYIFKFKLTITDLINKNLKVFRISKTDPNDYFEVKLDNKDKDFSDSNYYTVVGETHTSGTIIPSPKAWDSPENIKNLNIEDIGFTIENQGNNKYFVKTISQSFIDNSEGDVYTDLETIIGTNENTISISVSNESSWSDLYDNISTSYNISSIGSSSNILSEVSEEIFGSRFIDNRPIIWWPISTLSGATITDVTIDFKTVSEAALIRNDYDTDSTGNDYWVLINSTSAVSGNFSSSTEDYDGTEWYDTGPTEISDTVSMNQSTDTTITFTLNSSGITDLQNAIDNSDDEWGCMHSDGFSAQDTTPDVFGDSSFHASTTNYISNGNTDEPVLNVTYTTGGGGSVSFLGAGKGAVTTITTS